MSVYILVLITASSMQEAEKIGMALVDEGLAACCNIVPEIRSIFKWKGKLCDEKETLMFVKSRASLFEDVKNKVKSLHSYEVPEIIAFPINEGLPDYFKWMDDVMKA